MRVPSVLKHQTVREDVGFGKSPRDIDVESNRGEDGSWQIITKAKLLIPLVNKIDLD
jgi:hypothetical protein